MTPTAHKPGKRCRRPLLRRLFCMLRRRRGIVRGEEGAALVEFAVSVPILLSCFFGLIQVCLACYIHQVITEDAREGTRYAMVRGTTCLNGSGSACTATVASINSYVSGLPWPNLGGGTVIVSTSYPDGNEKPGSRVKVAVTYAFPFKVPFVPSNTINMSTSSTMYIVQ